MFEVVSRMQLSAISSLLFVLPPTLAGLILQAIQTELEAKAEDTFLWVSLVCKRLEEVRRDQALSTIQSLPPGLHPFYDRILHQISKGEPEDVRGGIRLLKSMILTYRPTMAGLLGLDYFLRLRRPTYEKGTVLPSS